MSLMDHVARLVVLATTHRRSRPQILQSDNPARTSTRLTVAAERQPHLQYAWSSSAGAARQSSDQPRLVGRLRAVSREERSAMPARPSPSQRSTRRITTFSVSSDTNAASAWKEILP